jgi:deoxyribonuclease-4
MTNTIAKFGTAGAGDLFYEKGYKTSQEVPAFLATLGLSAFEYQCGRGVRIGDEKAQILGENAREHNVALSVHAPYYISLTTDDPVKIGNNLRYFRESAHAATQMGASRVVFHSGSVNKKANRREAFQIAYDALKKIITTLNNEGYHHLTFCPETMGKMNQLGDLEEVLEFCNISDNLLPCVDFGHLNSRMQGAIKSVEDYENIFTRISEVLGEEKARIIHCHFSKIEYGAGGEKKHLTFADEVYGPPFEPLVELLARNNYTPTIICESAGTQAEDAKAMWDGYKAYIK